MSDEEREPRLFTLTEAERTRRELEPILIEAMDCRRKMAELEGNLSQLGNRIMLMGGILVPYEKTARLRFERDHLAAANTTSVGDAVRNPTSQAEASTNDSRSHLRPILD